jgi:UDP-N-acetylglucosamine--N-acetylmuramyl-(pentapeptide) pyrophosphoryl-undecaprenol N-acetylglucosamine transferase
MRLVLTGGHLSPALAVIDSLSKEDSVLFIGRKHAFEGDSGETLEYKEITGRNIPFHTITTGRLQRRLTRHTIPSLLKAPVGYFQALSLLRKNRPDAVLLFGGYLSLPVAFAARTLRIPIVIHEQTLEAGLANKIIAPFASAVCISWDTSRKFFSTSNIVLTGNPVREVIFRKTPEPDILSSKPLVYVTGGSAGSHAINVLVEGCLERLLDHVAIIHQTGDAQEVRDYDRLVKKRESLSASHKDQYIVKKFVSVSEIGPILNKAELVISRSGMNTVTELAILQKPAILIPIPVTQRDEQRKNALFLQEAGLAQVLDQQTATPDSLFELIVTMLKEKEHYRINPAISATIKKDATQRIIDTLRRLTEKKAD